jgi:hypothetical protein
MPGAKSLDCGQCRNENAGHLRALEVLRRQDKGTDTGVHQGHPFNFTISDARVLCQDNPLAPSNLQKPLFISGIGQKVVIMHSDICASLAQRIGYDPLPKVAIQEQDEWSYAASILSSQRMASSISSLTQP